MLKTDTYIINPVLTPGLVHADNLTEESARTTEELLKDNNANYHIFFTMEDHMGVYLHNHIAHHDLTIWAMGATPEVLRSQHQRNALYQRPSFTIVPPVVQDLEDDYVFKRCLGKEEHFRNFERFFLNQINQHGYQAVIQKYLVGGSEIAEEMHCHIYMGYVHGLIHIGLAFEFRQPLLLAEGLAQAAVHHDWWYTEYLRAAEALAAEAKEPPLPLADLIDMERADPKISTCSSLEFHTQTRKYSGRWAMDKEIARDGVLPNAKAELVRLAARWRVDPDNLEKYTAELVNAALYITAGAQRPPYQCTFDFWILHTLTASIGHVSFLKEESMTKEQKARLIEYSGRCFMMTYAGLGVPELRLDYLCSHRSKLPNQGWPEVFERATRHEDDGHMAKMIRSTKVAEDICKPYDHLPEIRVKQHMCLIAGIAMIDSASSQPMTWTKHWDFVRGAGWEDAWKRFPKRDY
ncbi:hypothetical protein F5X99DRAFT_383024 [Biscogniauxia marginata]|nr:hypothetical protein F5X99DRAFT_383024 [Biscogniauxia marginata]